MNGNAAQRMRWNAVKGSAWVVGGIAAILILEQAWDAGILREPAGAEEAGAVGYTAPTQASMVRFVLDDDAGAIGAVQGVPDDFLRECFSPAMVGQAQYAEPGPVVGITSSLPSDQLFATCAEALQAHGWLRVDAGQATRASFAKETGRYRWAYLDVAQVSDAGAAVIVLEEAA